jgi:hypothetical protein
VSSVSARVLALISSAIFVAEIMHLRFSVKIRAIALENHPSPSNPLGVKGAGEGAIIPVGGLTANAVANALASFGAMPRSEPCGDAQAWRGRPAAIRSGCCEVSALLGLAGRRTAGRRSFPLR